MFREIKRQQLSTMITTVLLMSATMAALILPAYGLSLISGIV